MRHGQTCPQVAGEAVSLSLTILIIISNNAYSMKWSGPEPESL